MFVQTEIDESIKYIKQKIKVNPSIALILGSGLGEYADMLDKRTVIPYELIPHFPLSTVDGHKGQLIFGKIYEKNVVCMQGRIHYYESKNINDVLFPINVFAALGIKVLITTNATGGINDDFNIGDYMIITDHIGIFGLDPLIGKILENEKPIFKDSIYDDQLISIAQKSAIDTGIKIKKGVMAYCPGPSYETPAEIKMLKLLGADNVGMSTVPEVISAKYLGLRVLSISAITNIAAGLNNSKLIHNDVLSVSQKMKNGFKLFINNIINNIVI